MIVNRQSGVRVSVSELSKFLKRARRRLRIPPGAVTVCLVSRAEMARWNRTFRHQRGATDVLSFPADDANARDTGREDRTGSHAGRSAGAKKNVSPSASFTSSASSTSYLGDIAIAPAVARENARRFGRTLSDELRILVLHGVIHLMGYDHETDQGEMDRFERSVRRSLGLTQP
jgi:probable rRNA maturation factor